MRRSHLKFTVAAAGLVLVAGCAATPGTGTVAAGGGATSSAPTAGSSKPESPAPSSAAAAASPGAAAADIPTGFSADRNASADITAALATAARTHREVLVDFGADWCPDCVALDGMFHSAQVEPILTGDYVVVPVDVGDWNLNLDVAARYVDLQSSGIPALVVLSSGGKTVTTTDDGSFSNARTMAPSDVAAFLDKWAPGVAG